MKAVLIDAKEELERLYQRVEVLEGQVEMAKICFTGTVSNEMHSRKPFKDAQPLLERLEKAIESAEY